MYRNLRVAEWLALPTSDQKVQDSLILEEEFNSWLYSSSLHKAFITLPLSLYDLNNVERDVKH